MAAAVQSKTQPIKFDDADQIIHAIHHGDVDAFVVMRGTNPEVITLAGADEQRRGVTLAVGVSSVQIG